MSILIQDIHYRHFKGLKRFDLELAGADADIYAENGIGKTTLKDGFLWLVTGKNADNKADFSVKTLRESGESVSGFEHEVGATLIIDGRQTTLKRVFHEVYTKKRGSARDTFSGHTSEYWVDEIKVSEKEFREHVAAICDESLFRLLTDLAFFNTVMKWEDRRSLLFELAGDISDAEVIESDPRLAEIPELLGERTIEAHKKWLAERRKKVQEELKELPARIDEAQRQTPTEGGSREDIEKKLEALRIAAQEKHTERARIDAGGQAAELTKYLRQLEADLLDIETAVRREVEGDSAIVRMDRATLKSAIDDVNRRIRSKEQDIASNEAQIQSFEELMEKGREAWREISAREFVPEEGAECPTCGALPEHQPKHDPAKALADFNAAKAALLEENVTAGRQRKTLAGSLALENEQARKEITELTTERERLEGELEALPEPETKEVDLSTSATYTTKQEEIAAVKGQIEELKGGNESILAELDQSISEVQEQIKSLGASLAAIEQGEQTQSRISELKAREKELNEEYEEYERQLFLLEEFVKAQAAMMTSKINSRFKLARFKLFDVQINEGIKPCCVTTMDGVPFADLNTGKKIRVGLDIIATLSEHFGTVAPIFVDNAESITDEITAPGQLIRLIASPEDHELRVETKSKEKING